jgi:hypothetical protein
MGYVSYVHALLFLFIYLIIFVAIYKKKGRKHQTKTHKWPDNPTISPGAELGFRICGGQIEKK